MKSGDFNSFFFMLSPVAFKLLNTALNFIPAIRKNVEIIDGCFVLDVLC